MAFNLSDTIVQLTDEEAHVLGRNAVDILARGYSSKRFAFAQTAGHPDFGRMIVSSAEFRLQASARMVKAIKRAEADLTDGLSDAEASEAVPRNDRLLVAVQLCQAVHYTMSMDPALAFTDVPRPVLLLVRALSDTVHGSRPEVVHWTRHPLLPQQQVLILQDLPVELKQHLIFEDSRDGAYDRLGLHIWRLKAAVGVPHLELGVLTEAASAIADYCKNVQGLTSTLASYPAVAGLMSDLVISLRAWMDRRRSLLLHDSWTESARGRPVVLYRDLGRAIVVAAYELLCSTGAKPNKAGDWVQKEMSATGLKARTSEGRGARELGAVHASHIRNWSRRLASSDAPLGWMKEVRDEILVEIKSWPPFLVAQDQSNQLANLRWALADTIFTARMMIRVAGSFWIE